MSSNRLVSGVPFRTHHWSDLGCPGLLSPESCVVTEGIANEFCFPNTGCRASERRPLNDDTFLRECREYG